MKNFRLGWRLLLRHPLHSAVDLLGLAAGFAVCFVLLGFAAYSFGYDRDVPQREQVFIIKHRLNFIPQPQWLEYTPFAMRAVALNSGLPLQASIWWPSKAIVQQQGGMREIEVTAVDPVFEQIAGLRALQGNLHQALTQPDGVALTRQASIQLFGTADALGRSLTINQSGQQTLQVRAILPDRPSNSTMQFGVLVGIGSSLWTEQGRQQLLSNWMGISGRIYVKTSASPQALQKVLQDVVDKAPWDNLSTPEMKAALYGRKMVDVGLGPLADAYFDRSVANTIGTAPRGDLRMVLALGLAGLLILLLAVINYVNLATVRTLRRQREIGVRKLLGASAARLVGQFLAESVLTALLAAAAGLLLAWLVLPLFADLVQRPLEDIFTPLRCVGALLAGVLTGLCAGAYPAWCALRVRPGPALAGRGNSETAAGLWLRRVLTVLQFGAAMALCAATLAVGWQSWYGSQASPGFDPRGFLVLDLPPDADHNPQARAFEAALARLPGIDGVAGIAEAVGRDGSKVVGSVLTRDGRDLRLEFKSMTPGWFALHRIQPQFGRLFDPSLDTIDSQVVVLNAAAALALGYPTPQAAVGQVMPAGQLIIGIAPPLRFLDMRQAAQPMLFNLRHGGTLSLRSDDDVAAAYAHIEPLWRRYFPDRMLELRTAQSFLTQMYAEDLRLARMLGLASLIAMLLAAFGIYVLAAYSVQRRTREIVMRKLHGAGRTAIARLVGREFLLLLAAGAVLGLPLAALGIYRYLAGFIERAPIGGWTLAAALLLAMLVALLATWRHTWSAMRMSPALALRD